MVENQTLTATDHCIDFYWVTIWFSKTEIVWWLTSRRGCRLANFEVYVNFKMARQISQQYSYTVLICFLEFRKTTFGVYSYT